MMNTEQHQQQCTSNLNDIIGEPSNKRKREEEEANNDISSGKTSAKDILEIFDKVVPILIPSKEKATESKDDEPNEETVDDGPTFPRQRDYLATFLCSQEEFSVDKETLSWQDISGAISNFLSYHMIRKVWGEDSEGLRNAARAMYNLVHYCNAQGLVTNCNDNDFVKDCAELLVYTSYLGKYPYEVAFELQT